VALAWAVLNQHFQVAEFLLAHGADVNTDWATDEPSSILHECAVHGDFEGARFMIAHGVDLTIRDHRWNGTVDGRSPESLISSLETKPQSDASVRSNGYKRASAGSRNCRRQSTGSRMCPAPWDEAQALQRAVAGCRLDDCCAGHAAA